MDSKYIRVQGRGEGFDRPFATFYAFGAENIANTFIVAIQVSTIVAGTQPGIIGEDGSHWL